MGRADSKSTPCSGAFSLPGGVTVFVDRWPEGRDPIESLAMAMHDLDIAQAAALESDQIDALLIAALDADLEASGVLPLDDDGLVEIPGWRRVDLDEEMLA